MPCFVESKNPDRTSGDGSWREGGKGGEGEGRGKGEGSRGWEGGREWRKEGRKKEGRKTIHCCSCCFFVESVDGSPISSPVGPRKQDSTTSSNSVLNVRMG